MHTFRIALAFMLSAFSAAALAQQYELTGNAYTMKWHPPGSWSGRHAFEKIYCVTFPNPAAAIDLSYALYNRSAIYLTTVLYPDNLVAAIVVSSIPPGRTAESEVSRLRDIERQAEHAAGVSYHITESVSAFGPTIGLRINNVADRAKNGPFPLVRPIYASPKPALLSMSAHRLFVRGGDRFEVAVIQLAKQPTAEGTEAAMAASLGAFADELMSSLQQCTSALPVRDAK